MSERPTIPPIVNRTMKFILRSPAHGVVSKTIMLITFTGRKSGKSYSTPVSYSQDGEMIYAFTHGAWWKNLRGGNQVTLRIRGQDYQGLPEPVEADKQAVAAGLMTHLKKVPSDARYYGVSLDENKDPNAADCEKAAQNAVMLRIRLC